MPPFRYDLAEIVTCREPAPLTHRVLGGDFVKPGFLRRNAIVALEQMGEIDPRTERCLLMALGDPYFEVRAAATIAIKRFASRLTPEARTAACIRMKEMVRERNFEVAMGAVEGLAAAVVDDSVLDVLGELHYHRNWRVRNAVVLAYLEVHRRGIADDRDDVLARLDDILITCDSFTPSFELKENLLVARKGLSPEGDDDDHTYGVSA